MAEPKLLKLHSPAYGESIFYKWPLVLTKKHDEAAEIVDTIKLVCEDFPELRYAVDNVMLKEYDGQNYDCMNRLCQRYNKAIRNILSLWKGRAPPPRMFKPPNKELLRHIINLCYSHAIKDPEKLNSYEPFSPEVYGETSFDMIAQILEDVPHGPDDTFIDLGSGVGQVVLQAAASNQFKECLGVEKADIPAYFAVEMEKEFKKWMDWYGKIYTEFTLEKGDFMDAKWQEPVNEAGFIFVNNFAFGPVVNHHLKNMFQSMKEGAKLISSREFCSMNFKFNKRNLSELGAMMRISEIRPRHKASVSWTGNTVSYYLHVVDRTRLEKYFSLLQKKKTVVTLCCMLTPGQQIFSIHQTKNLKEGLDIDEDESSIYIEGNPSNDPNNCPTSGALVNVETLEDNLDDLYLGTTTRHQWQLLTDTIKQSKKEAKESNEEIKSVTKDHSFDKQHAERKKNLLPRRSIVRKSSSELKNTLKKYTQNQEKYSSSSTSSVESDLDDPDFLADKDKRGLYLKSTVDTEIKEKLLGITKSKIETNECKEVNNNVDSPKEASNDLENDVDVFLRKLKYQLLDFIKVVNTKEYAEKLTSMIEFEKVKNKLLLREVSETEMIIQNLINIGLKNFSQRLSELDIAVKTPLELLAKSSNLAVKHRALESKVLNMEVEVSLLEQKYEDMYNCKVGMKQTGEMPSMCQDILIPSNMNDGEGKHDVSTKVCFAIMNALNQRHMLIDKSNVINEQISLLEKAYTESVRPMEQPAAEMKVTLPPAETLLQVEKQADKLDFAPKSRPVAFVPPRMLNYDKTTISPTTVSQHQLVLPPIVSISPFSFLSSSLKNSCNSFAPEVAFQNNSQSEATHIHKRARGRPRKNMQLSDNLLSKKQGLVKGIEKNTCSPNLIKDPDTQYESQEKKLFSEEDCSSGVFSENLKSLSKHHKSSIMEKKSGRKIKQSNEIDDSDNTIKKSAVVDDSRTDLLSKCINSVNKEWCSVTTTSLVHSPSQMILDEKQSRGQDKVNSAYQSSTKNEGFVKFSLDSSVSKTIISNIPTDNYVNLPKVASNFEQRQSVPLEHSRQSIFVSNSSINYPQQSLDKLGTAIQDSNNQEKHSAEIFSNLLRNTHVNKKTPEIWNGFTSKTSPDFTASLSGLSTKCINEILFVNPKEILSNNNLVNQFHLKQDSRKAISQPLNFKDESTLKTSTVSLQESYNPVMYQQSVARSTLVDDHFYASLSHLVSSRVSATETNKISSNKINFTEQTQITNNFPQTSSIYFPFPSNGINQSSIYHKSLTDSVRFMHSGNLPNSLSHNVHLFKSVQEVTHPTMTSKVTDSKISSYEVGKNKEPLKKKRRMNQLKKITTLTSSSTNFRKAAGASVSSLQNFVQSSPKIASLPLHTPQYRLLYQPNAITDSQNTSSSFSVQNNFCLSNPIEVQSEISQSLSQSQPSNNFVHSQVINWNKNLNGLARVSLPNVSNAQITVPVKENISHNSFKSNGAVQQAVFTTQPHLVIHRPPDTTEKSNETLLQTSFLGINQSASSPTYPPLEKLGDCKAGI